MFVMVFKRWNTNYASHKPWITPTIKAQIKAIQEAFCRGNKVKFEQLRKKISKVIRNAK